MIWLSRMMRITKRAVINPIVYFHAGNAVLHHGKVFYPLVRSVVSFDPPTHHAEIVDYFDSRLEAEQEAEEQNQRRKEQETNV